MKTRIVLLTTVLAASLLAPVSAVAHGGGGVGITFGAFYSSLGPFGEWITVDAGVYAWRPMNVAHGWRPYWDGRWMWTDDGWYWDSDEPWAWATYHYGRWYYDDYYGWLWIPGYDWAPAWVEWRYGGDYVGWAPLGPYAVFNVRFGVIYSRHWITPYHYWSFVDCRHMLYHRVRDYIYRSEYNTRFIGRTRTAGSVWYDSGRIRSRGPETGFIERRGNIRIPRTELVEVERNDQLQSARRGERDRIGVYRPRVEERNENARIERPDNVRDRERMPSLDTRQMDVRSRDVARESRRETGRAPSAAERSGEQRSGDRNSRWYEVTPPAASREVEQPVNPDVRGRRDAEGRRIERRVEQPAERSLGVPRPQDNRPTEQYSRPYAPPQNERRSSEGSVWGPSTRRQSEGRSSGGSIGSPSVRQRSQGQPGGRPEGRPAERPSTRGRTR